jgi:hypothetical protein
MSIQSPLIQSFSAILKKFGYRIQKESKAGFDDPQIDGDMSLISKIREMAATGKGTDACLKLGCLPMPVNFYSPVPDIDDLEERRAWSRRSDLNGIDFRKEAQISLLEELGKMFGQECEWPQKQTQNPIQFYTHNGSFSFGCAASVHCMIRKHKPTHVIEVGSGYSSLVISHALSLNADAGQSEPCDYTIIDPYPGDKVRTGLPALSKLKKSRVELVDPIFFERLAENDVLFIDSGHTVRTGSDVNYLILDVLPRLARGVVIHFHDIPLPYEYQKVYFTNPAFRMFWTEAYLLQAFLIYNSEFEILLAMEYLMREHMNVFCAAFPYFDLEKNWANSGSFWVRRK